MPIDELERLVCAIRDRHQLDHTNGGMGCDMGCLVERLSPVEFSGDRIRQFSQATVKPMRMYQRQHFLNTDKWPKRLIGRRACHQ